MPKRWALTVAVWLTGAFVGGLLMTGEAWPASARSFAGLAWLGAVVWTATLHQSRGYWVHVIGSVASLAAFPILWPIVYVLTLRL